MCPCNVDVVQELLWVGVIDPEPMHHLLNTFRTECVLGIDIYGTSVKSSLVFGKLDVNCHLVDNLALTGTKFTIHLGYSLGLQSPTHQGIEFWNAERKFPDILSLFEDVLSGLEPADI